MSTGSPTLSDGSSYANATEFGQRFDYEFDDPELLRLAVTHRSFCAENPGVESNERLEFLGDAVLGLAVTDHIHATYPALPEGQLAKLRASVVNTVSLADRARGLDLGSQLLLGKGEDQSGGRQKESILADALEAVIGAVYVDGGWEEAREFVLDLLGDDITHGAERPGRQDFKTRLQELTAQLRLGSPTYRITGSGPDHDRRFHADVIIDGEVKGDGSGTSKKRAEQAAARSAWTSLNHSASSAEAKENGDAKA